MNLRKITSPKMYLWIKNNKFVIILFGFTYKLLTGKRHPTRDNLTKQKVIREISRKYSIPLLVETGTFLGDMIFSQRKNFEKIISIELDNRLFLQAKKTFQKDRHIQIIEGDSGEVLKKIVPKIKKRALFWLDGHYSGNETAKGNKETPIVEELNVIFSNNRKHVILIDDANYFNGKRDYPTVRKLKKIISKKDKNYSVQIKNNIIILEPGN